MPGLRGFFKRLRPLDFVKKIVKKDVKGLIIDSLINEAEKLIKRIKNKRRKKKNGNKKERK